MESVIQCTRDAWSDVNLLDLQKNLETTAVEIALLHEINDKARAKLINQTHDFRKSAPEEVRKSVMSLLRSFQTEFDGLLKRYKFTEEAFLTIYKSFIDLPDPVLALNELNSLHQKALKTAECEHEMRKLKENYEEVKADLATLKNFERENKRLRQQLNELVDTEHLKIQQESSRIKEDFVRKLELKEQEHVVFRTELEEKISASENKCLMLSKALELSQSEVFKLKSQFDSSETGRSSELELLIEDLEKSNAVSQPPHSSKPMGLELSKVGSHVKCVSV